MTTKERQAVAERRRQEAVEPFRELRLKLQHTLEAKRDLCRRHPELNLPVVVECDGKRDEYWVERDLDGMLEREIGKLMEVESLIPVVMRGLKRGGKKLTTAMRSRLIGIARAPGNSLKEQVEEYVKTTCGNLTLPENRTKVKRYLSQAKKYGLNKTGPRYLTGP